MEAHRWERLYWGTSKVSLEWAPGVVERDPSGRRGGSGRTLGLLGVGRLWAAEGVEGWRTSGELLQGGSVGAEEA